MSGRAAWIVVGIGFWLAAGVAGAGDEEPQYVGAKKCKTCHKKELIGNQYGVWKEAKHAQAFETLKGEKALEIAKQKGLGVPPHEAEQCLKCHVTAYGEDPSKFARRPLAPEDGVQCESCHGPGSLYRKKKIMSDREKAVAAGMWEADKEDKICAACHNEDSPVVPEGGVDFAKLREGIQHPIPEDVKGRYLEIEKQLKAERQAGGEAVEAEEE